MVDFISQYWVLAVCFLGALTLVAIYSKSFGGADMHPGGDSVDLSMLLADDD